MSQKKVRFNIVDIIVILVLIAGIAFVGARMYGSREAAEATGDAYHVTFRADCIPEEVAAALETGCAAEKADGTMALGELVDFATAESVVYTTDSKGSLVQTTKPGYVSVTLVCELTAEEGPTGLLVGTEVLNVGHTFPVRFGLAEIEVISLGVTPAA